MAKLIAGTLLSIGLMSGTCMDGIDASLIRTDGLRYVSELATHSVSYPLELRIILKGCEYFIKNLYLNYKIF